MSAHNDIILDDVVSQDIDSDSATSRTLDMRNEMDDERTISHDDIVRVSTAILAQRKARSMIDQIHNPDHTISSPVKEVMTGQDRVIEHQAGLICRLNEQIANVVEQNASFKLYDRYHREHIRTLEHERQIAGIGDLEPPQDYQSLYHSSRRSGIQRSADDIVNGELAITIRNLSIDQKKATPAKSESNLEQERAILAKNEAKDYKQQAEFYKKQAKYCEEQASHHKESLRRLVEEESRVKESVSIQNNIGRQNNIQAQTNVYINSLHLDHSQDQGKGARRHTPVSVPQEPAPTIPFFPQLRDQVPLSTGPRPRYTQTPIPIMYHLLTCVIVTVRLQALWPAQSCLVTIRNANMGSDADGLDVVSSIPYRNSSIKMTFGR